VGEHLRDAGTRDAHPPREGGPIWNRPVVQQLVPVSGYTLASRASSHLSLPSALTFETRKVNGELVITERFE
jgi:hypothetical protein